MTDPPRFLRIAHVLRNIRLENGGPPRSVLDAISAQAARGHALTLISPDPHDVPGDWVDSGMLRVICPAVLLGQWGPLSPSGRRRCEAALGDIDVLHFHLPWDPINYQLSRIAARLGVAYCVSTRGTLDRWAMSQKALKKRAYLWLFARRMLEGAGVIHYTADAEREDSRRWFSARRETVIPNLMDVTEFRTLPGPEPARERLGISGRTRVLLYMSRIHPGKGLEYLIRAMPHILAKQPEAMLVVAGRGAEGYVRAMQAEVERAGVSRAVRFIGFQRGSDKLSLMELADVMVLASSHENFGNALFHAAACGCPTLVTREVATWKELVDSRAASLVTQDPRDIAVQACKVLSQPLETAGAERQRIRGWALRYFATEEIVSRYERAYLDCIG